MAMHTQIDDAAAQIVDVDGRKVAADDAADDRSRADDGEEALGLARIKNVVALQPHLARNDNSEQTYPDVEDIRHDPHELVRLKEPPEYRQGGDDDDRGGVGQAS
jgi:hypothetical protein